MLEHSTANTMETEQPIAYVGTTRDQQCSIPSTNIAGEREQSAANMVTMHTREQSTADTATTYNREHFTEGSPNFTSLYKTIGFEYDSMKHWIWPSASDLSIVFPVLLTRVTAKRDDHTAWVRVTFSDPTHSILEMFVTAPETRHIAKELFDLNMTEVDGQRGVLLDAGVFIQMKDTMTLSGAPIGKVAKLLGTMVAEAYQSGPERAEEIARGILPITHLFTMEIWPSVECSSLLTLRADVNILSKIAVQMWPYSRIFNTST
jgi:hypothetical protein